MSKLKSIHNHIDMDYMVITIHTTISLVPTFIPLHGGGDTITEDFVKSP